MSNPSQSTGGSAMGRHQLPLALGTLRFVQIVDKIVFSTKVAWIYETGVDEICEIAIIAGITK